MHVRRLVFILPAMTAEEMKNRIETELEGAAAYVQTDGHHYEACVVGECFRGLPRVKQHKLVYAIFKEELKEAVHALALKTFTPDAWEAFQSRR